LVGWAADEKHAEFVIDTGGASRRGVFALIERLKVISITY